MSQFLNTSINPLPLERQRAVIFLPKLWQSGQKHTKSNSLHERQRLTRPSATLSPHPTRGEGRGEGSHRRFMAPMRDFEILETLHEAWISGKGKRSNHRLIDESQGRLAMMNSSLFTSSEGEFRISPRPCCESSNRMGMGLLVRFAIDECAFIGLH
jgi:hypothetical protein